MIKEAAVLEVVVVAELVEVVIVYSISNLPIPSLCKYSGSGPAHMFKPRHSSTGKANVACPKPSKMPNVNLPRQLKAKTTQSTSGNGIPHRKVYTTEDTTVSRSPYTKAPTEIHPPLVNTVNVNHSKGIAINASHHEKTRKR